MRCLALFTGGLDSQIAARLMQRQGIEVVGVNVSTPFTRSPAPAEVAARNLQIELHTIEWTSDFLQLVQQPLFGYAQEMAPCLDCRIGMVARAKALLEPLQASFLISGEVIGQRPSSLRSRDLETIAVRGGMDDLLLRPLSALLLPETLPERSGWVDRSLLFGWQGKARREQLQLAREWRLSEPEGHEPGCTLLETTYAGRLRHLLLQDPQPASWHLATLRAGRHFWHESLHHLILSKNAAETDELRRLFLLASQENNPKAMLFEPCEFRGPVGLLTGNLEARSWLATVHVLQRYGKQISAARSCVEVHYSGKLLVRFSVPRQSDVILEGLFVP